MTQNKDFFFYLNKIILDASVIIKETKNISYEQFMDNQLLQDGVCFRIIQISETCSLISDNDKQEYSSIPWHEIKGLRNRLVHEYGNVDYTIIYQTVKESIPNLKHKLDLLIQKNNLKIK